MLLAGPDRAEPFDLEFSTTEPAPAVHTGDRLVLGYQPNALPQFRYIYLDRDRRGTLAWLALLFAAVVVALGRWRGLAALAGLVASFVVLLTFIVPAILDGSDPLLVAVVGCSAIAFLALYLAHGFGTMTTVALLGTLASLALAAVVGTVFVHAAAFTGLTSEEAFVVRLGAANVNLSGLLLAGLIIGALGAIDDMAVTQASSVWELRAANPTSSRRELLRASMRIGQDHVSSTVNTLALAYAGASLPLLILFVISRQSLGTVANSEIVAAEIVRTLVGGIALVACVPFTTWLAVLAAPGGTVPSAVVGDEGGAPTGTPRGATPGRSPG
jgi:uncharacterized membrane protein